MEPVDRLHRSGGILERRLRQRAHGDVDEETDPVRDVPVERRLELHHERVAQRRLVERTCIAVDAEERRVGGHELADQRDELKRTAGPACRSDDVFDVDPRHDTGPCRPHHTLLLVGVLRRLALVGIRIDDHLPRLLADELDQGRDAQRLPDVLHVDDQHNDAGEDEQERRVERDARHPARPVTLVGDRAERQQRVDERRDEQPDRELARLVPEDPLNDPRRELAHRQLDDDHRDRQHEGRQADHRCGDRRQHRAGGRRRPGQAWRKRLVAP